MPMKGKLKLKITFLLDGVVNITVTDAGTFRGTTYMSREGVFVPRSILSPAFYLDDSMAFSESESEGLQTLVPNGWMYFSKGIQ
jgi:hypothetical protein